MLGFFYLVEWKINIIFGKNWAMHLMPREKTIEKYYNFLKVIKTRADNGYEVDLTATCHRYKIPKGAYAILGRMKVIKKYSKKFIQWNKDVVLDYDLAEKLGHEILKTYKKVCEKTIEEFYSLLPSTFTFEDVKKINDTSFAFILDLTLDKYLIELGKRKLIKFDGEKYTKQTSLSPVIISQEELIILEKAKKRKKLLAGRNHYGKWGTRKYELTHGQYKKSVFDSRWKTSGHFTRKLKL